jgi:hypothetical protein
MLFGHAVCSHSASSGCGGMDSANVPVQRTNNLMEARATVRGHQSANAMRGQAMTRYEYKFVRVELKSGLRTGTPKEDYQKIVHDHAKEGWRLFQRSSRRRRPALVGPAILN